MQGAQSMKPLDCNAYGEFEFVCAGCRRTWIDRFPVELEVDLGVLHAQIKMNRDAMCPYCFRTHVFTNNGPVGVQPKPITVTLVL